MRLKDKTAIVTGAASGIGKAIAQAFAREGADVAIFDINQSKAEGVVAELKGLGRRACFLPCDVGDSSQVRSAFVEATRFLGRLDILVNNTGVIRFSKIADMPEEDWDFILRTNLKSVFLCSQQAARQMIQQGGGGRIINLGSLSFEIVVPNIGLYAISKGGMRQMTRALAVEWADDGILVNAIAPGRFWTAMTDAVFADPALHESAVSVIPLRRPGVPADLAGATVLLASDASAYITGQTIVIDGGWLVAGGTRA